MMLRSCEETIMFRLSLTLSLLWLVPMMSIAAQGEPPGSIPSYQEALNAFQAQRATGKASPFSAEDRQVMERAARDLAVKMPDPGLKVGDTAPDFELPNAFGRQIRLQDLLSEGPVVLTFFRGAWCPYCNLQLRGLKQTLPHIEQQGARLVAVTPQMPDKSREQVEKDGYPFEILSDLDDRVMKTYGLFFEVPSDLSDVYKKRLSLDLAEYNGEGRYVLPVPATFVVGRDRVIRAAFADPDYRKRVEPSEILAALQGNP